MGREITCKTHRTQLQEKEKKLILGVDPGIANTGYGVVESHGNRLIPHGYGNIRNQSENSIRGAVERDLRCHNRSDHRIRD